MSDEMDRRVEDVARTLHWARSLEPDRYWEVDYEYRWEDENWGAIKATRLHARELIEKFDAASGRVEVSQTHQAGDTK